MAKRVSFYRASATVMSTLVGKVAELIVNTTRNTVHVHDGVTVGGVEMARADLTNVAEATADGAGKMTVAQVATLDALTPSWSDRISLSGLTQYDLIVPSTARRIYLYLQDVQVDANTSIYVQIKSGTVKTTGYTGFYDDVATTAGALGAINAATGIGIPIGWGNLAYVFNGCLEFTLRRNTSGAYEWYIANLRMQRYDGTSKYFSFLGGCYLAGLTQPAIDSLRLTTFSGTAHFSASSYLLARFE